jgi:5-methyltetrahydropteroyltriglutamate--homocysteine methyltransferase
LPKLSWFDQPEKLWSPWKLQDQELIEGKQDALRLSLHEQENAGIDIVSDPHGNSQIKQRGSVVARLWASSSPCA